jgi:hypothetical protein
MGVLRYSRGEGKMPDVVVIPVEYGHPNRRAGYFERLVFYRDTSNSGARLLITSKTILKDAGGFDASLGFGEDRLLQEKVFDLVKIDDKSRRRFRI